MPESSQSLPRAFDPAGLEEGKLREAAFGVELLDGVDAYDMAWRAARYGILFIIVPFAVLFLFELIARSRVHPVQYALIGLANCLFYLLLLSLSEILGFGPAYAIAAATCSLLCGFYAVAALKSKRGYFLLPALALLYAYLYAVLSSEDYALLLGSLGLLALLVAAMAVTRKVDWYGAGGKAERPATASDAPSISESPEAAKGPESGGEELQ
jgi:inner membrane protein